MPGVQIQMTASCVNCAYAEPGAKYNYVFCRLQAGLLALGLSDEQVANKLRLRYSDGMGCISAHADGFVYVTQRCSEFKPR